MRRSLAIMALLLGAGAHPGCTCTDLGMPPQGSAISAPYTDSFDRPELGPDWSTASTDAYRIENGELVARRAYNHPLWLRRALPAEIPVERYVEGYAKSQCVGTAEDCFRDLAFFAERGVRFFILYFPDGARGEMARRFADQVLPRLRATFG